MQDKGLWFIHGLAVIGQNEYPVMFKHNETLLKYLKSGKNIKIKDIEELEVSEGEPKDE